MCEHLRQICSRCPHVPHVTGESHITRPSLREHRSGSKFCQESGRENTRTGNPPRNHKIFQSRSQVPLLTKDNATDTDLTDCFLSIWSTENHKEQTTGKELCSVIVRLKYRTLG